MVKFEEAVARSGSLHQGIGTLMGTLRDDHRGGLLA